MLRSTGEYSIERWLACGVPLATVRSPLARGPLPAVVIYHSFAGKKTDNLLSLAVPLADAGCLAILPDAAMHGERAPHDFALRRARDHDALFLDSLRGTVGESEAVLRWVADRDEVDEERLGVVGVSMGGAVVLALACRKLFNPLQAAIALMPATPEPGSAVRQEAAYAPDPEACFPTPLLMIHGTDDHRAPYPNARHFYDDLVPRYAEAPERLRFIDVPGEEYRIGTYWVEETLAWLGRFL
ncbi:MAG TPA: dienelactone hydrolase family protein [Rubrobacter sp.]